MKKPERHPRAHIRARAPSEMAAADSILLDERGAEKLTGLSGSMFRLWRRTGRGPMVVKIGRLVRYRRSDVIAFVNEHAISPEVYAVACRRKHAAALPVEVTS